MALATSDGVETALARFDRLASRARREIATTASRLVEAIVGKIRLEKLSGEVLNARSGALRDSITGDVEAQGETILASIGSIGDIKYAAIQEYGGTTSAHEILPSKSNVLAFISGGQGRFAKRIEHPGSVIPERSYLRSSLDEMRDEIIADLTAAVANAWEET